MSHVNKRKVFWITALAVVLVALVLMRSNFHVTKAADPAKTDAPAVPVMTTTVKEQDIPTYLSGIGSVTPLYAVTVKVRVDGQLDKVAFSEGQDVAAGSVLAQIDP